MNTSAPVSHGSHHTWAGQVHAHVIESEALRGNPLGDPHQRPLYVYTPPGYEADGEQRYPTVYVIQGYTGQVEMWHNRVPFRPTFPEAADAVYASGQAPPTIVVYVDAWTAYGGSQFLDSPGTGDYQSYLCDDVVAWVDEHYPTLAAQEHRGISGKSSGGYGAMVTPMLRPGVFGALATHAGDALFELCYLSEFGDCVRALREYDGDILRWWADFGSRPSFTKPQDAPLLEALGYTAAYSAADDGTPLLPFDPHTGVLVEEHWQRWLDLDPVRLVPRHLDALQSVHTFWIDAGTRDEYYLDVGAAAFRQALLDHGIPEERIAFELFDAGHGAIDYRYPLSLAHLSRALAPAG